ncbi:glycosyltransferase family 2 protein [Neolewinella aurantiaca]|uniref:Glycosyltransferase family 2 protein n=1 Tax=Neolewinella aurantiaca TaxID=2602767 RepID=A0A5C7F7A3_9BACT|nr:glycosyltransferase family 2 protein [Neolewinella aurantiaca]TXF85450.1 glycosyltransferase family 2 protein [Neolewinella aurantiaca]
MTSNSSDIWVCLPAYNEATVLEEVFTELRSEGFNNVCVIDDGSSDGTGELARRLGAVVATHPINRGAGAAVMTGIQLARQRQWQHLAFIDADGQHVVRDLHKLRELMQEQQCDLVVGSRFLDPSLCIPRSRRFFNGIANTMTNMFARGSYTDSQSGMRLLNRNAIVAINLDIDGFGFCSEMLMKAESKQLAVGETAISVRYTDYSVSKGQDLQIGFTTALNFLWNIVFR